MTTRVSDFIASQGVDTHIPYTDGAYANIQTIISDLSYLGINHIRDGMIAPGQFGSAPYSSYVQIAKAGIKYTLVISGGGPILPTNGQLTNPSLDQRISYVAQLESDAPGSVVAIEGSNEINNEPLIYKEYGQTGQGQDELNAAVNLQRDLYNSVHENNGLRGVSVYYFTGYNAGSIPVGPDPSITTGLADADTQHPYPNYGQAPAFWVSRQQALGNETSATTSAVYTETGYSSNGGTGGGVNLDVQAKYTLDLMLDCFKNGISSTYLYELLDAYAPGSRQGDAGWGLFDYTGTPKPVAKAIHNMNLILADNGQQASSFTPTQLAYTVSGKTATSYDMEMARSDGSYVVALWDEQSIWNTTTGAETSATAHTEKLVLGTGANTYSVSIYDPMTGTMPTTTQSQTSQVSVTLTDHPLFLIATPSSSTAGTSSVTLQPSIATITGNVDGGVTLKGRSIPNSVVTISDKVGTQSFAVGSGTKVETNGMWSLTSHIKINTSLINAFSVSSTDYSGNTSSMPGVLFLTDTGADRLTSSSGVSNIFSIMSFKGSDIIDSFKAASVAGSIHDVINFSGRSITNFAQVQTMMSGSTSTIITMTAGKTVTLEGVNPTALSAADFAYS